VATAQSFAEERLGKTCIYSQDRAGFVVNALLIPYLLSAIKSQSASRRRTTSTGGMVLGCALPMGPLALADLIGSTLQAVAGALYEEFRPRSGRPGALNRMVEAGAFGRSPGRGSTTNSG